MQNISPFLDLEKEYWKPIIDPYIKDIYEISNFGRVRNIINNKILKRCIIKSNNPYGCYYQYRLAPSEKFLEKSGGIYREVHKLAHRLTAEQFINIDNSEKYVVNHKNGYKFDCTVGNLEWTTSAENNRHSREILHPGTNCGSNHHMAKLNEMTVHEICKLLVIGASYSEILKTIGMEVTDNNKDLIGNIKRKKSWKHISDRYFDRFND